ncbi:hypothetical protein DLAC_09612 [Tieghemostelium lacteum]|uniref:TMS membrane protein n=1 Tax=Tieghemostelium lacteum TaxID=361077 RepID=A0A151Z6Q4_TIELA|nr:hypothetical protein DLAC_09612 [Tieghemostelium lacteum]|eukprot:KYQ89646.1 hypothetical protein DLAC_09612 [Tieghemostelium lacteum]
MSSYLTSTPTSCCPGTCCGLDVRKSTVTRIIYVFFFLLLAVLAYVFSYFSFDWLNNIDILKICSQNNECYGALVVFRISFGLALYHVLLALILIGVKSSGDGRAKIQDGLWPIKILLLAGLIFAAFFIPNSFFIYYGWICIFGAAFFVLVQLVLLIEFAYGFNETCVQHIEEEGHLNNKWYITLFVITIGSIAAGLVGTILMLVFFSKSCSLNQFFIVFNLGLSLIVGVLSMSEKVREYRPSSGLFQSGVVFLYTTYLIYSAIMSEPEGYCPSINADPKKSTIIIGAVFTIISVCYSAFRASDSNEILGKSSLDTHNHSNYSSIPSLDQEGNEVNQVQDDECECVTYNYTFFHITFAVGAMYLAMLLTNWSTISGISSANVNVDSGLVSVWVKVISSWVIHVLYLWTLIAPVIFPDRQWD